MSSAQYLLDFLLSAVDARGWTALYKKRAPGCAADAERETLVDDADGQ